MYDTVNTFHISEYEWNEDIYFHGFIMNEPTESFFGWNKTRHWFAVTFDGQTFGEQKWYNWDSRQKKGSKLIALPNRFIKKVLKGNGDLMILYR